MAFTIGTATFTNGSTAVTSVSLTSGQLSYFYSGTAIYVDAGNGELIEAIGSTGSSQINLRLGWGGTTGTYSFVAFDTIEGLRDAVQSARGFSAQLQSVLDSVDVNPTADSLVKRTSTGAARVAEGVNADEALVVSQATEAATASKLVKRTGDGRVKVANATESDDAIALGQAGTAYSRDVGTSNGNVVGVDDLPDGVADLYAKNNILGTVSQSGGVPTGAVIERGSNANGEYTKYADGTMICWFDNLQQFEPGTRSDSLIRLNEWIYPVSFINPPSIAAAKMIDLVTEANILVTGFVGRGTGVAPNASGTSPLYASANNPNGTTLESLWFIHAIGRWY